jgi:signal transduction histidine kinase
MKTPPLRSMLTAGLSVLALLTVAASAALVIFTTLVHVAHIRAHGARDATRLVELAQRDLLLHREALTPQATAGLTDALRIRLDELEQNDGTFLARGLPPLYDDAHRALGAYLVMHDEHAPTREVEAQGAVAYASLSRLAAQTAADERAARQTADRWDKAGDIVGVAIALILLGVVSVIVWSFRKAFRPLFSLLATMDRFGEGQLDARAAVEGPAELRDMATRFNGMADALVRQRDAQRTFLSGVAHDLRNPLGALRLSLDMLRKGEATLTAERRDKLLAMVTRQTERLERMIQDLVDTTTIEAGHLRLVIAEHDARALAREVVELFERTSARHRLEIDAPPTPVKFSCDGGRIAQVLTNLVSNAIKYSPAGGTVRVCVAAEGDEVKLEVRDEGVGIDPSQQREIFRPYRRAPSTEEAVAGTGIGLFVVKRIVEAHEGRIDVRSTPGKGSTFAVYVPAGGPTHAART